MMSDCLRKRLYDDDDEVDDNNTDVVLDKMLMVMVMKFNQKG